MRYLKIKDVSDTIGVSRPTFLDTIRCTGISTYGNKIDSRDLSYVVGVQRLRNESKIRPDFLKKLDKKLILNLIESCENTK
jgi:hypothetical protein